MTGARARVAAILGFGVLMAQLGCLPTVQSERDRHEALHRRARARGWVVSATPASMRPIGAVFGDKVKLLGYRADPQRPRPGQGVQVTFYWTALRPVAEDYQIFVHGDAVGDQQRRIHGDHFPAQGRFPTDGWRVGEVVVDTFNITIPPGYGARHLGLFTGLYRGDYRLPLSDGGSRPHTGDNRSRAVDFFF